jgi:hypothetical protein
VCAEMVDRRGREVSIVEGFEVSLGCVSTWFLSCFSTEIRLTGVISGGANEILGAQGCAMLKGDSSHVFAICELLHPTY